MLKDPRLGPPVLGLETAEEFMWRTFARWLLDLDGDRHRAMRQRFARIFTAARVPQYRSAIEARAHALIDVGACLISVDLQEHITDAQVARCDGQR
jgi:cytochrome P450